MQRFSEVRFLEAAALARALFRRKCLLVMMSRVRTEALSVVDDPFVRLSPFQKRFVIKPGASAFENTPPQIAVLTCVAARRLTSSAATSASAARQRHQSMTAASHPQR